MITRIESIDTSKGFVPISLTNVQVYDGSASWLNSALINTAVNIDIPLPATLQRDALYEIIVTNPSAESALDVSVKNKATLGGVARYPEVLKFQVLVNSPEGVAKVVQGFLLAEAGRLTLSNATALGAAGAFTARVHVRMV